jgi:hypothetical protein
MAGCGLPRTNPRAPSFSLCCSPTVRRLLVLHGESNPTTSRLVCVPDAEEIIDAGFVGEAAPGRAYYAAGHPCAKREQVAAISRQHSAVSDRI